MSNTKTDGRGQSAGSMRSRFKKGGPSPNAKGRPRGSKNHNTTLRDILNEPVLAELAGRKLKITVFEAVVRRLA